MEQATDSSPTPTLEATKAPRSPRGSLIKKVGEPAGSRGTANDVWDLKFTVTDIQVDPICTSPHAEPPVNGHFVAVSIEATTGPEPEFSSVFPNGVGFGYGWKAIASNGTTANTVMSNATYNCLESSELINGDIRAAEKVAGKVILDVPDAAGTLVFSNDGTAGWEWEYGTK